MDDNNIIYLLSEMHKIEKEKRGKINTIEDIKKAAKNWHPKFAEVDSIEKCADLINRPHEDYPKRVGVTKDCIEILCQDRLFSSPLTETDIKQLHSILFRKYNPNNIQRGDYRAVNVWVGGYFPPEHYLVSDLMKKIMPASFNSINFKGFKKQLLEWYSLFQKVHPYQDGNARIGGIVIASYYYLNTNKYLAPLQ